MSNSNEYDSESGPEWDYNESDSDASSQSEWEEDKSDEESDNEWDEVDEAVGTTTTTTRSRVPKRQREYDSESDTDESDSEDEKDENGNLVGLIVDDDEEIEEDNHEAAALNLDNIVHSKRRRLGVDRFVAEPAQIEPTHSNKWYAFKEVTDELNKMNKMPPNSELCERYKTLLKNSIAETPSLSLSNSTGWFDAVKTMPQHRRLDKYKKSCINKLHIEWVEEEKRLHAKKLAKIAELCVV